MVYCSNKHKLHAHPQETGAKEANLTRRESTHHFMTPTGCAVKSNPGSYNVMLTSVYDTTRATHLSEQLLPYVAWSLPLLKVSQVLMST